MTLVAGSYDRFILGWSVKTNKPTKINNLHDQDEPIPSPVAEEKEGLCMKARFTHQAHMGPVKCIAMAGPVLATGGDDDTIRVYDLAASCDLGSLQKHNGSVTTLAFYTKPLNSQENHNSEYGIARNHNSEDGIVGNHVSEGGFKGNLNPFDGFPRNLLSGSMDGTVRIWDPDTWVDLKVMQAHKKGVNDLCIHPSGKLALSVGRDNHLSMFNLVKGRRTFSSNLRMEATAIRFNGGGDSYSMVVEKDVFVHRSEDAKLVQTLHHGNRVLCLAHDQSGLILTGGEESTIRAWDISSGKLAYSVENAHKSRIKGLAVLGSADSSESTDSPYLVASASSDGIVKVWDVRMIKKNPNPVIEADSKTRLTCLVGGISKKMKRSSAVLSERHVEHNEEENISVKRQTDGGKVDAPIEGVAGNDNSKKDSPKLLKKKKKKKTKESLGVIAGKHMKVKGQEKSKRKENK